MPLLSGQSRHRLSVTINLILVSCLFIGCSRLVGQRDPVAVVVAVVDSAGDPVPNTNVFLMIQPDADGAANTEVGDRVVSLTFAEATTDGEGMATLRLHPDEVPAKAYVGGMTLNVAVHAFHRPSERFGVWHLPLNQPERGERFWAESSEDSEAPTVVIQLQDR
ncbi:MAG: hypothetical protein OER95_11745 [Acidimicrobiia bacterium]|nr:hypothetical protein [Acidimicrobiia bacterium]